MWPSQETAAYLELPMARYHRRGKLTGKKPYVTTKRGAISSKYSVRRDRRVMQKTVTDESPSLPPARSSPAYGTRALSPSGFADAVNAVTATPASGITPASAAAVADSGPALLGSIPEEQINELRRDIIAARELQLRMLPSKPPRIFGYEVTAFYDACDMLAGDFFEFVEPDVGHTGFLVADVSGHGLTAAMLMSACMKTFSLHARNEVSPKQVLCTICRELHRDLPPGRFVTAFYAVLNHRTGELRYARAGHNPAFLWHKENGQVSDLKDSGLAIGLGGPDLFAEKIAEGSALITPGSALLLYSDGITEAHDARGEQFGEERLREVFGRVAGMRSRPMVEKIIENMRAHTGSDVNEDDLTMVLVKREQENG